MGDEVKAFGAEITVTEKVRWLGNDIALVDRERWMTAIEKSKQLGLNECPQNVAQDEYTNQAVMKVETPVSESAQILSVIAAAARDPQVDVEKMRALLAFKQDVDADEARKAYWRAYSEMAAVLPRVKKDGKIELGSKGSIPFATWEQMDAVLRPILKQHGFSLSFPTRIEGTTVIMTCILSHVGGHSERSETIVKPDPGPGRNETQAGGSGRSYAKRYLTRDIINMVTEGQDDDGRASGFISAEQSDKIYALLDGCDLGPDRRAAWLAYMKVDVVEHIQKFDFDRAVNSLRAELKKQGKQLA